MHREPVFENLRFKDIIVGLGDLDFPAFLKLLKDRDIPFIIEVFSGYGAIDVYLCKRQVERLLYQLSLEDVARHGP